MSERAYIVCGAGGDYRPGFYRVRLVKDGPWVPVHLAEHVERDAAGDPIADAEYRLEIDGDVILNFGPKYPQGLLGEPITEAEYDYMRATTRHAVAHEPTHPAANPYAPIDLMTAPLPF